MSAIWVTVIGKCRPGKLSVLMPHMHANAAEVRQEKGLILFDITVDTEGKTAGDAMKGGIDSHTRLGPDAYLIIEKWASVADHQAHRVNHNRAHTIPAEIVKECILSREVFITSIVEG